MKEQPRTSSLEALARGNVDFIRWELNELLQFFRINLDPNCPDYRKLALAVMRAFVRALEDVLARNSGEPIESPKLIEPSLCSAPPSACGLRAAYEAWVKTEPRKYWKNPDELKAQVIQSISAETKRNPQEGWIRAGRATDPAVVERMRQTIEQLRSELKSARIDPPVGAEQYAQGADTFVMAIEYETRAGLKKERVFLELPSKSLRR